MLMDKGNTIRVPVAIYIYVKNNLTLYLASPVWYERMATPDLYRPFKHVSGFFARVIINPLSSALEKIL